MDADKLQQIQAHACAIALVGLMLFLSYLGFVNCRSDRIPSAQVSLATTEQ